MLPFVTFYPAVVMETKTVIFPLVFPTGIDIFKKICYIAASKSCDEDTWSPKDAQRGSHSAARLLHPCPDQYHF